MSQERVVARGWQRRLGPRELVAAATIVLAHRVLRAPPNRGRGFVSDEEPVIIVGMHRSGTSIVTRLLERSGLYVGGSWVDRNHESIHFLRANRRMIGEGPYMLHNYGWASPVTDAFIWERRGYAEEAARHIDRFFLERRDERVWGWKDPRTCLTLPVWLAVYPRARVLHVVRDGRAVAISLAERDEFDPAFGLALWGHYLTRAERALTHVPPERQHTVRYEDLLAEPERVLTQLFAFVGLTPREPPAQIASLLDREPHVARRADPRFAEAGDHPLLAKYGYV